MNKSISLLLVARDDAPCPGVVFDAWLLPVVMALLAPAERDCMETLLCGEPRDGWIETPDLANEQGRTLHQMGAVLSNLRALDLIETWHELLADGRVAHHRARAWVVEAERYRIAEVRVLLQPLVGGVL